MAGIGDLVATCASPHSRNGRLGAALVSGKTLEQAQKDLGMVAEGVNTAKTAYEMSQKNNLETPLIDHVYRIIYENLAPKKAVESLMEIPPSADVSQALLPSL